MYFLASWKRALGVDLISYRFQYHIVCIFPPWIRLSNEGCMLSIHCKIALFFYFPLWPVRHFENSSRRACALRGVSGCVHLESRKTNVRRTGERVWYDAWVCVRNCVKRFSFSLFLRLKAGVADTAGTWDTIYIYIYIYIYWKRCFPFVNLFLLADLVDLPFYTRSFIWNFPQYHNPLNNSHSTLREISLGDISSQRSFTSHFPASVTFLHHFSRQSLFTYDLGEP